MTESTDPPDGNSFQAVDLFASILDQPNAASSEELESRQELLQQYLDTPLSDWVLEQEQSREFYLSLVDANAPQTVADVLLQTHPERQRLVQIRSRAKAIITCQPSPIEHEVATAVYYLSYSMELKAHFETKTKLPISELVKGIAWLSKLDWLPDGFRSPLEPVLTDLQSQA